MTLALIAGCALALMQPSAQSPVPAAAPAPVPVAAPGPAPAPKLRVVVANDLVRDLVQAVGGDEVEVTQVGGLGGDAHHTEPTPADAAQVARADLVVALGLGLDRALEKMQRTAGGGGALLLLADGLGREGGGHAHAGHAHEAGGHDHGDHGDAHDQAVPGSGDAPAAPVDPHAWHDPVKVITMAERLRDAFTRLRPSDAAACADRCAQYCTKLRELDAWIRGQVAAIPPQRRAIVTTHDALGHWGARYGVRVVGVEMDGDPADATPAQVLALVAAVRAAGAPVILGDATHRSRLAEVVARESGTPLAQVLRFDGVVAAPAGSAYLATMRANTQAIVEALRP